MSGPVALLAEGVDRNMPPTSIEPLPLMSPSSQRAWIEISWSCKAMPMWRGRPPRRGRG